MSERTLTTTYLSEDARRVWERSHREQGLSPDDIPDDLAVDMAQGLRRITAVARAKRERSGRG